MSNTTKNVTPIFQSQIGKTTYEVSIHFSKNSKETMQDKIIRMIEKEVKNNKGVS